MLHVAMLLALAAQADDPEQEPGPQPGAPPAAKAPSPEQARLQKLLQTRFDRRESAIFRALVPPAPKTDKKDPVDVWIEDFTRDLALGAWDRVKTGFASLPKEGAGKAYAHLLNTLMMPHQPQDRGGPPELAEQNLLLIADVLGLADAAPTELEEAWIPKLAEFLKRATSKGEAPEGLRASLRAGTARLGGKDPQRRETTARLLLLAGRLEDGLEFLPPETATRPESLNLRARYHQAAGELPKAWAATQAVLATPDAPPAAAEEALSRALELVPGLAKNLGRSWLEESFTTQAGRGIRILGSIGALASEKRVQPDAAGRLARLELISLAVDALLRAAPERATEWKGTLTLLALNWMREAEISRSRTESSGFQQMRPQFDRFGNVFYNDHMMMMQQQQQGGRQLAAIAIGRLIELRPSAAWTERVDASLRPRLETVTAQLHIAEGGEAAAFAAIEAVSKSRPKEARDLAHEFLQGWMRSHDPNQDRRRTNRFMYAYGYNPQAEGIPLTRSKQVRNLTELSEWIRRLRGLKLGDLDEQVLSSAFTTAHSTAEVFRLEDLESVFGELGTLKPATLAELSHTMRRNLATVWRQAEVQKATKRKDAEIQAEVLRGYATASRVLDHALAAHPDQWALLLAKAATVFDENTYRQELAKDGAFSERRGSAFELFKAAAERYAAALPSLAEKDESSSPYEYWFYASLGATEPSGLKHGASADARQHALIREAIRALGDAAAERHLARFANSLWSRIQNIAPEMKHAYLKGGLAVTGDHALARDAKKLLAYYSDLVTEIKLVARLDGPAVVGHGGPFGLFVELRHTKEIERESGGFAKYLQNQGGGFYYNFGRPPVNYRERFEETAREALKGRFDVISVTFHSDKVVSRGTSEEGWRLTPYAYLLLRPKGPEVDAVPSLRLDLDFMDTSGFAVLPIESPRIPIDAAPMAGESGPVSGLKITQTLDDRKAAAGAWTLEIRASALGLVPTLDKLLDLRLAPLTIAKTEDPGVSVVEIESGGTALAARTERTWTLELKAAAPGAAAGGTFRFGKARLEGAEMTYQRYEDADLKPVPAEFPLGGAAPATRTAWLVSGLVVLALAVPFVLLLRRRGREDVPVPAYAVPSDPDAVSVLRLLRRMRDEGRMKAELRVPLETSIHEVEHAYFAPDKGASKPDLRRVAERWVLEAGAAPSNGRSHQQESTG